MVNNYENNLSSGWLLLGSTRIIILPLLSVLLFSCSNKAAVLSLEERLHNAYLDVIEEDESDFRNLVTLDHNDERVIWNSSKVLMFTLHRFPSSYPAGEEITFTWGESWLCSYLELTNWYQANQNNIKDVLLRVKQVLGMSHESKNTYISAMWLDPNDLIRPAYITDVTKQVETLSIGENETDDYKAWFNSQYYYSYDVSKLPWTRLGYTYDWSAEAKDKYGLSEFIAWKGTTVTVEKTLTVEKFVKTL